MAMGDVAAAELFAERAGAFLPPGDARVRRVAAVMWQLVNRLEPGDVETRESAETEASSSSDETFDPSVRRSRGFAKQQKKNNSAPARRRRAAVDGARRGRRVRGRVHRSRRTRVRALRGFGSDRFTRRQRFSVRVSARDGARFVQTRRRESHVERVVLRRRRRVVGGGGAGGRRLLRRRLHRRRAGGRRERRHAGRHPAPLARHGARGGPRGRQADGARVLRPERRCKSVSENSRRAVRRG